MKKCFSLIAGLLLASTSATLQAQCLKVYSSADKMVAIYPLSEVGPMPFSYDEEDGYMLSIAGLDCNLSMVDSITVDLNETYSPHTITIDYNDLSGAWMSVSSDLLFSLSDFSVNGNHVSVIASDDVDEEINYILRGQSSNGSFYMDGKYKATLTLDGVNLTNPDSAAICIENGKRINVDITDGTVNTLVDGPNGTQKACFFINGHAEIKGAGILNITGRARHAYASDEYTLLKPSVGTINILSSANDGLHIGQYFEMNGGTVNVNNVKGDCVDVSMTKDATDENNGWVFVNGGTLNMAVTSEDVKGLKSEASMTIQGGTIQATVAGNGCKGISVGGDLVIDQAEGAKTDIEMDVTGTTYTDPTNETNTSKCRGIKVKGNYTLKGGNIHMNVTGKKAKGISVDGKYTYEGGTTNVIPE